MINLKNIFNTSSRIKQFDLKNLDKSDYGNCDKIKHYHNQIVDFERKIRNDKIKTWLCNNAIAIIALIISIIALFV